MRPRTNSFSRLHCVIACLFFFVAWQSLAATVEVDWTSAGFSTTQITINAGDEVDIVNLDDTFDLQVTGAPPASFYSDIPPFDGTYYYYVPYVYHNPGTFSFSDEFGDSVTVIVNSLVTPLSVAITDPTNNTVYTAPATFTVTAVPAGGVAPYTQVQFFVGSNLTDVAYNSPFTGTVSNLLAGTYSLSAVVTDNSAATATNSILVTVVPPGPPQITNYIVPVACGTIYSSGVVNTNLGLTLGSSTQGGIEFAEFNTSQYSTILLEISPDGLPLFDSNVSLYGFDGGTGTLTGTNYNSGTLIGVWTLPPGLTYGQPTTYDVTAFVKATKGPYFGFILQAVGDVFGSLASNYGLPPELYAIAPVPPPKLAVSGSGNQIIISWPTNNASGLSLKAAATPGPGASWTPVSPLPALVGNQWMVTNSITGASRFFRLSNQ